MVDRSSADLKQNVHLLYEQLTGKENALILAPPDEKVRIKQQIEYLCSQIREIENKLSTSKLNAEIPKLLPYSANRIQQEDDLDEALEEYERSGSKRPLVCIVHGNEYQCHPEFIDRLEREILPRLLELNKKDRKVQGYSLDWPVGKLDRSEFRQQLKNNLLKRLTDKRFNSLEDLNTFLYHKQNPTLIRTQCMTVEWSQHRFDVLETFLEFWQDWPELHLGQAILICFCIRYENPKGYGLFKCFSPKNKLNQKIVQALDNLHQRQPDRLITKVLTELHGITRTEAEDWIERMSPKISQFVHLPDLRDAIRGLYQSAERISMHELPKSLHHLLYNDRIPY